MNCNKCNRFSLYFLATSFPSNNNNYNNKHQGKHFEIVVYMRKERIEVVRTEIRGRREIQKGKTEGKLEGRNTKSEES